MKLRNKDMSVYPVSYNLKTCRVSCLWISGNESTIRVLEFPKYATYLTYGRFKIISISSVNYELYHSLEEIKVPRGTKLYGSIPSHIKVTYYD